MILAGLARHFLQSEYSFVHSLASQIITVTKWNASTVD